MRTRYQEVNGLKPPKNKVKAIYHGLVDDQRRLNELLHHPDVTLGLVAVGVEDVVVVIRVGGARRRVEELEELVDVALRPLLVRRRPGVEDGRGAAGHEARRHGATLRRPVRVFVDDVRMLLLQENEVRGCVAERSEASLKPVVLLRNVQRIWVQVIDWASSALVPDFDK